MTRRMIYLCIIVVAFFVWMVGVGAFSHVIREEGKVYIVDGTGERWDFTQAESIGFQPEKFQYGLGRNAFTPLDDSYLRDDTDHVPEHLRVLGVVEGSEAKAYSIPRLRSHEIANSRIGSRAIAVGY